jgi:hypothetical protein
MRSDVGQMEHFFPIEVYKIWLPAKLFCDRRLISGDWNRVSKKFGGHAIFGAIRS